MGSVYYIKLDNSLKTTLTIIVAFKAVELLLIGEINISGHTT